MLNSLDWMMSISSAMVFVCMLIFFWKFKRYFENKKRVMIYQENNRQDIEILESKLTDIKLRNQGHELDENIKYISDDESVEFSMGVRDMIG